MTQILDSLPSHTAGAILCCYVNSSPRIQIIRITNISNWYFERVVFPGQRLLFEADAAAQLEIHTNEVAGSILADRVPCQHLQVSETAESRLS